MKSFFLILTSLLVLTACTVPGPSDFESTTKPMAENEFIAMWRYSRLAKSHEVLDESSKHKSAMEAAMAPLFEQVIPRIFSDIKNKKLTIREENDETDLEEAVIKDLPLKMTELFEGSWQNLSPYTEAFHITQRRQANSKGFPTQELELHLLAQDLGGQFPENRLGSVKIEDLRELDYTIELEGQTFDLIAYLNKSVEFAYPIFFKSQTMEAGLRSLDQAFQMKEIILSGEWAKVEWLAGEPNLSGMKMKSLPVTELNKFTGTYVFEPSQGSSLTKSENLVKVHIEVEEDYLDVEWPTLGPYAGYDIFPSAEKQFFTLYGDRITFSQTKEGKMQMTVREEDGTQSIGYR